MAASVPRVGVDGMEPVTFMLKFWPAQLPPTDDHDDPESVDCRETKVGVGDTSVLGVAALHFQPTVPVRTGSYALVEITGAAPHHLRGEFRELISEPQHKVRIPVASS